MESDDSNLEIDLASSDLAASDDVGSASINEIAGENISPQTFRDLLRDACGNFTRYLKNDIEEDKLCDSINILQTFAMNSSIQLTFEEQKMVLDLVLCAGARIPFFTVLRQCCTFLGQWMTDATVWTLINQCTQMKPYVISMGQRIYTLGDYEAQAQLLETLVLIAGRSNREYWSKLWFSHPDDIEKFMELSPQNFENECRSFLNHINQSPRGQTVYSFVANSVSLGSLKLKKPDGLDLWVDFNYQSKSLTFYCMDPFPEDEAALTEPSLSMWETFTIVDHNVQSCSLEETVGKDYQCLVVTLISSYWPYLSSKCVFPEDNDGRVFCFLFSIDVDLPTHVKEIFGFDLKVEDGANISLSQRDGRSEHLSQLSQGSIGGQKASCAVVCFQSFYTDVDTPKSLKETILPDADSNDTLPVSPEQVKDTRGTGAEAENSRRKNSSSTELDYNSLGVEESVGKQTSSQKTSRSSRSKKAAAKSRHSKKLPVNLISDAEEVVHLGGDSSSDDEVVPPSVASVPSIYVSANKAKNIAVESPKQEMRTGVENVDQDVSEDETNTLKSQKVYVTPKHILKPTKNSSKNKKQDNSSLVQEAVAQSSSAHQKHFRLPLFKSKTAPLCEVSPPPSDDEKTADPLKSCTITMSKNPEPKQTPLTTKGSEKRGGKKTQMKLKETVDSSISKDEGIGMSVLDMPVIEAPTTDPGGSGALNETQPAEDMDTSQQQNKSSPKRKSVGDDSGFETITTQNKKNFLTIGKDAAISRPDKRSITDKNEKKRTEKQTTTAISTEKPKRKAAKISAKKNERILRSVTKSAPSRTASDISSFGSPVLRKSTRISKVNDADSTISPTTVYDSKKKKEDVADPYRDVLFSTPVKTYSKLRSSAKKKPQSSSRKVSAEKQKNRKSKELETTEIPPLSDMSSIDKFQLLIDKVPSNSAFVNTRYRTRHSSASSSIAGKSESVQKPLKKIIPAVSSLPTRRSLRNRVPETASSGSGVLPPSTPSRGHSPVVVKRKWQDASEKFSSALLESTNKKQKLSSAKTARNKRDIIDPYTEEVPADVSFDMIQQTGKSKNKDSNEKGLFLEISIKQDGKLDLLKKYIEELPLDETNNSEYDPNDLSDVEIQDGEADELDSITAMPGSPMTNMMATLSSELDEDANEGQWYLMDNMRDSALGISGNSHVINRRIRNLEANFREVLLKYKNVASSPTSVSSEIDYDDSFMTENASELKSKSLVSHEFFSEAEYLSKKLTSTIKKFVTDFFHKLKNCHRNLFYSITSSSYERLIMNADKDLLNYQKSSSLLRETLIKELKKIGEALDVCIRAEQEYTYSLSRVLEKSQVKFAKEYEKASRDSIRKREEELTAKLCKRLDFLTKRFVQKLEF